MAYTGIVDAPTFVSYQPGGAFSIRDAAVYPGKVFWVGSAVTGASDAAGFGENPGAPFATLDYARAACTASRGDTIFLLPGHSESETTAATAIATLSVADVAVIGLGRGSSMATFSLGAADATLSITAANVLLRNIKIISDVADCAIGVTASAAADGLIVEDCLFTDGGLTKELVIGLQLAAACDGCIIRRNRFATTTSADTGGCASAIKLVGESAGTRIENNEAFGNYSVACIDGNTAAATGLWITDNTLINMDADASLCIKVNAASSVLGARNLCGGNKSNTRNITDFTASWDLQNFGTELPNTYATAVLATATNFAA